MSIGTTEEIDCIQEDIREDDPDFVGAPEHSPDKSSNLNLKKKVGEVHPLNTVDGDETATHNHFSKMPYSGWDAEKSTIMFESSRAAASDKHLSSLKKVDIAKHKINENDDVLLSNLVTDSGRRAQAPAEIHPDLAGPEKLPQMKPMGDNFIESNPDAIERISETKDVEIQDYNDADNEVKSTAN